MNEKFEFLTSTRFWALVLGVLSVYLSSKGWIGEAERNLIASFMAGFIGIKTVDKNTGDAKIKAAGVSSGQSTIAEAANTPPKG